MNRGETFRFLQFKVYNDTKSFYKDLHILSKEIVDLSLRDQLKRAVLSILLNIAEGSAKSSDKDFARFLRIAIGSVNEVVACIDILKEMNIITVSEYKIYLFKAQNIAKQLGGFIKSLTVSKVKL